LPPWVLDGDPALRRWLFSYGGALRLEGPPALVQEHRQWLKEALAALGPARRKARWRCRIGAGWWRGLRLAVVPASSAGLAPATLPIPVRFAVALGCHWRHWGS